LVESLTCPFFFFLFFSTEQGPDWGVFLLLVLNIGSAQFMPRTFSLLPPHQLEEQFFFFFLSGFASDLNHRQDKLLSFSPLSQRTRWLLPFSLSLQAKRKSAPFSPNTRTALSLSPGLHLPPFPNHRRERGPLGGLPLCPPFYKMGHEQVIPMVDASQSVSLFFFLHEMRGAVGSSPSYSATGAELFQAGPGLFFFFLVGNQDRTSLLFSWRSSR